MDKLLFLIPEGLNRTRQKFRCAQGKNLCHEGTRPIVDIDVVPSCMPLRNENGIILQWVSFGRLLSELIVIQTTRCICDDRTVLLLHDSTVLKGQCEPVYFSEFRDLIGS